MSEVEPCTQLIYLGFCYNREQCKYAHDTPAVKIVSEEEFKKIIDSKKATKKPLKVGNTDFKPPEPTKTVPNIKS